MNDAMLDNSILYDSPNAKKSRKKKSKSLDDQILDRLENWDLTQNKDDWRARCPGHDGSNKTSLSITIGEDGKLLLHCHSQQCSYDAILAGLGIGGAGTTEVGIAESWIEKEGEHWRYVLSGSQCLHWRHWNGQQWEPVAQVEVWNELKIFIHDLRYPSHAKKHMKKAAFITGAEKMARGDATIEISEFDKHPMLLNTRGGVVDLNTGKLRPHKATDYLSKIAGCTPDSKAECPQWLKALGTWTQDDKELQELLQVVAGLALRGDNIEQKFVLLHGKGQNGKSVFTDILAYVMGDYCKTASPTLFKNKRFDGHPTELMALDGMRLVLVPELGSAMTLDESLLKAFTGDGKLSARGMRQNAREFAPVGIPIMTCNKMPRILDVGQSMQRRALVIPFDAEIKEKDQNLLKKLQGEASAILAWAIKGHEKYLASGLPSAKRTEDKHLTFFQEQDAIARFMEERTRKDSNGRIPCGQLYQSFKQWMQLQGENYIPTQVAFTREISERWPEYERKKAGVYHWTGIKLASLEDDREML